LGVGVFIESKINRVVTFSGKIDFRKRFDGLLAICYQKGYEPYRGDCVVFMNSSRKELRVIFGDDFGLYLICRRFDNGKIKNLFNKDEITQTELSFLLQGAHVDIVHKMKPWKAKNGPKAKI